RRRPAASGPTRRSTAAWRPSACPPGVRRLPRKNNHPRGTPGRPTSRIEADGQNGNACQRESGEGKVANGTPPSPAVPPRFFPHPSIKALTKRSCIVFDPYHKWLGIPSDRRPLTPHRLLGVAPTEQDPEVLEEAALSQSARVRHFQMMHP